MIQYEGMGKYPCVPLHPYVLVTSTSTAATTAAGTTSATNNNSSITNGTSVIPIYRYSNYSGWWW